MTFCDHVVRLWFDVEEYEGGGHDVADPGRVEADVAECFERHFQDGVGLFGAGSGVGVEQVELVVVGVEGGAGLSFDGQGECRGFAFVAEIGQCGPVVAGPEGEGGQHLWVVA
jgi:hypothetical protein